MRYFVLEFLYIVIAAFIIYLVPAMIVILFRKAIESLLAYIGRDFQNETQVQNKYNLNNSMSFLGILKLRIEHTTKRWWIGFTFSLSLLVLSEYFLDLNIVEMTNVTHLTLIIFSGLYIFKAIALYFIYRLIKKRPRKENEIVDITKDIDNLKNNINGSLLSRLLFVAIIVFSVLTLYCIFAYIAFNEPSGLEMFFVVFVGLLVYFPEFLFLLFVEFYIQEVDARRIAEKGNIILSQGGNLSGWKRLEYNLAKRITERVTKRIEQEKKKT